MVIKEYYMTREDGIVLNRSYSDLGFYIIQNETNNKYEEAIDVENSSYTYSEIDEFIELPEATQADYILALKELGVNIDEETNA